MGATAGEASKVSDFSLMSLGMEAMRVLCAATTKNAFQGNAVSGSFNIRQQRGIHARLSVERASQGCNSCPARSPLHPVQILSILNEGKLNLPWARIG